VIDSDQSNGDIDGANPKEVASYPPPATLSFSDAIALTQRLLSQLEHESADTPLDHQAIAHTVAELLSTKVGGRGFLATYLTYDGAIVNNPPIAIIDGLRRHPVQVADLMIKNLAMSSAMAIVHRRNHDTENLQGSLQVQQRAQHLILTLSDIELVKAITDMISSLNGESQRYQDFLKRQAYDSEQRAELTQILTSMAAQLDG
jgi:hypothetical protein